MGCSHKPVFVHCPSCEQLLAADHELLLERNAVMPRRWKTIVLPLRSSFWQLLWEVGGGVQAKEKTIAAGKREMM
jgi:hypothetical protein